MYAFVIISFLCACVLSAAFTMVVRRLATRYGLTDRPDTRRKLHGTLRPLGGGLAVFAATCTVLGVVLLVPNPWGLRLHQDWLDVIGFFGAGGLIVTLGLLDEPPPKWTPKPWSEFRPDPEFKPRWTALIPDSWKRPVRQLIANMGLHCRVVGS